MLYVLAFIAGAISGSLSLVYIMFFRNLGEEDSDVSEDLYNAGYENGWNDAIDEVKDA